MIKPVHRQNIADIRRAFLAAFKPPMRMTGSQWADEHARLSEESSHEGGRWKTLPYQREILDAMCDQVTEQVYVKKSARVGYTKLLNHCIAYHIHQDPCSMLMVQPTIEDAEGYSKEEIATMIRDTPILRGLVSDAKAKDGSNSTLHKMFPGGVLSMVGANSPRGFRRISRRIVIGDEVSGWPQSAGSEGTPWKLAIKRSEYFWNRKLIAGSTPTEEGDAVDKLYLLGDQRQRFVPCPHCGEFQVLRFGGEKHAYGIKWPKGEPMKAYYACEHNGCVIEHKWLRWMDERGEWRPTAPGNGKIKSYFIWAGYSYSPNSTWGHIAQEFLDVKDDPMMLRTFVNTVLGECWSDDFQSKIKSETLQDRAEPYPLLEIPDRACIVTIGADVQADRLEVQTVAFGPGEESWVLNYAVIYGSPTQQAVWDQLLSIVRMPIRHKSGVMVEPFCTLVDSGDGNTTNEVYAFARRNRNLNVLAIKGMPGVRPAIGAPSKQDVNMRGEKIARGVLLYPVGVDGIKSTLYARLREPKREGAGVIHFPEALAGVNPKYYGQLVSERQKVKQVNGYTKKFWVKEGQGGNEALDTFVYAYAGLHFAYSRYNRETIWKQLSERLAKAMPSVPQSDLEVEDDAAEAPEASPIEPEQAPVIVSARRKISLGNGWARGAR